MGGSHKILTLKILGAPIFLLFLLARVLKKKNEATPRHSFRGEENIQEGRIHTPGGLKKNNRMTTSPPGENFSTYHHYFLCTGEQEIHPG